MTIFEKIKNEMDIKNLSYMLLKTGACPFDLGCSECTLYTDNKCPLNYINERMNMIKWLESEVPDEK